MRPTYINHLEAVIKIYLLDNLYFLNGQSSASFLFIFSLFFLKKMGLSRPLFLFIFVLFSLQFQFKLKKASLVCLGFEPGAAGW